MSKYVGKIITNQAPAGYSVYFDGTGDNLSLGTAAALNFGTSNFTVDFWYYPTAIGVYTTILASGNATFGSGAVVISGGSTTANAMRFGAFDFGGTYQIVSDPAITPTNTWTHYALTRSGNTFTLYRNGVSVATNTWTGSVNFNFNSSTKIGGGTWDGASSFITGNISNLRAINGTALYTAAFTPPTQLLNVTNTSLLTCNSPAIVDQSSNAFAITANGNAAVSTFTPFTAYVPYNPALGASTPGVWTLDEAMQAAATRQWNMYDPSFNLTTLLLHGNGTNGAQNNTFLDSSSNNFTITRNGNTTQGSFSPFSQTGWSNFFVASASSTIGFANNAAFQFGAPSGNANDFVVEFFVYPTTTAISAPVHTGYTSGTTYWGFNLNRTTGGVNTAGYVQFYLTDNFNVTATTGLVANQQNHICAVRTGTTVSLFVNGIRQATGTSSVNPNPTGLLYVGGEALSLGRYLDGYVSNLRIIKGATLPYDANALSITVPTSQLTAITGTTVLTCQSNRFVDNSSNGLSIAITGTPSVQAFSPFYPTAAYTPATIGGSGYFDGTGDFLTVPSTSALAMGAGDFFLEMWIYPTAPSGNQCIYANFAFGGGNTQMGIFIRNGNSIRFSSWDTAFLDSAAGTIVANAWHHLVVCRAGNNGALFINGTRQASASGPPNDFTSTDAFSIGRRPANDQFFPGYICGLRSVKGSSIYDPTQTTITVPTAPPTAITNTQLLLNFTNAGIVDSTAKNVLETVGNAQISTAVSKFGGGSMYFDGSGDYLVTPSSPFNILGSGDFTVEFWMYPSNTSSAYRALVASENYAATTGGWSIYQNGTSIEVWLSTATQLINATSAITATTWQHVALSRASGTVRLFVNGTSIASASNTAEWTGQRIFIGDNNYAGTDYFYNGYIDDLRITRGIARYIGNFTPQTSQWQDQ